MLLKNPLYFLGVLFSLFAAHAAAELVANEIYAPATPPGAINGAVYLQLHNTGGHEAVLVAARTEVAGGVEFHEHRHQDGMMAMREVERLRLAPGAKFSFAPGAHHIMLTGLHRQLCPDESFALELELEDGRRFAFQVPVTAIGAGPPVPEHHPHNHHDH